MALTQVSGGGIKDGSITNADLDSSAAIDGSKVSPDFSDQNITTTGTATAAALIPSGATVPANGVYLPSANNLAISTNGTGRLFVDSSGQVGIGTASPGKLLAVGSAVGDGISIGAAATGTITRETEGLRITGVSTNKNISFVTAGSEACRIDTSGRLLVGTPSSLDTGGLFQVNSDTSGIINYYEGADTTPVRLRLTKSRGATTAAISGDGLGEITFRGRDTSNNLRSAALIAGDADAAPGASSVPGRLVFSTTLSGSASPQERLRITSDGKLGLGTSDPAAILTTVAGGFDPSDNTVFDGVGLFLESSAANGDGNYGSALAWSRPGPTSNFKCAIAPVQEGADIDLQGLAFFTASGAFATSDPSERLRIDSQGRLLVGTDSGDGSFSKFQVSGNTSGNSGGNISLSRGAIPTAANQSLGIIAFGDGGGDVYADVKGASDGVPAAGSAPGKLLFSTTAAGSTTPQQRLLIDSQGRVGIGTTTVGYKLDVQGDSDNLVANLRGRTADGQCYLRFASNDSSTTNALIGVPAANTLNIFTGGQERARIDSSGRLLVGTSSASTSSPIIQAQGPGTGDSAGRVVISRGSSGIGVTTGTKWGEVLFENNGSLIAGRISCEADAAVSAGETPGRLVFSTTSDSASSPSEALRIDSNQRALLGRATGIFDNPPLARLHVYTSTADGNYALAVHHDGNSTSSNGVYITCGQDSGAGTLIQFADGNGSATGSITFSSLTTAYNTSSDYRLKENVVPLTGASARLNQLPVHRFNFIGQPDKTFDGFLAHEAQAVVPECVTGTKDEVDDKGNPVYQGIDQSKLVPLLTAALQEALHKIETQAGVITALDARLKVLEGN